MVDLRINFTIEHSMAFNKAWFASRTDNVSEGVFQTHVVTATETISREDGVGDCKTMGVNCCGCFMSSNELAIHMSEGRTS